MPVMHRTSFIRLVATWLLAWAASWAAHAQDGDGNYLHFETVTASAGEAWTSEIRRVSEEPIKGMQFDLTWPEGVAFDMDAMALSPEWGAFQLSVSALGDNTYRVLVFTRRRHGLKATWVWRKSREPCPWMWLLARTPWCCRK